MSEFDGQVVIVTGAAGNLGRATALASAEQGARLALFDRNADRLANCIDALGTNPDDVLGAVVDLFDQASVELAVRETLDKFGRIDVLANIAGGFTMGRMLHETTDRDWNLMMDLNARSIMHTCRAVVPGLLQQGGGRIINIAARAAREGKAKMGAYCASKAAVITLTESLAAELKFDNINANCILPGTIDTPENRQDMPDADHGKWVAPEALADVVVFLASQAGRAVTGAAIPVFGQS